MEKKYEAMFIIKPDLSDVQKKDVFKQIAQEIEKLKGRVTSSDVWQEKRRFTFRIRSFDEGLFYLVKFSISPDAISKLKEIYKLNESILRVLILNEKAS